MTIIFDLNRTLFDPETAMLIPGAFDVLRELSRRGYELHLISRFEKSREVMVEKLGIAHFFKGIHFVEDKEKDIACIMAEAKGDVYLIGDYLHDEIRFGNTYGAKTIWFKNGAFQNLKPEQKNDVPWRTVASLSEVLKIIPEAAHSSAPCKATPLQDTPPQGTR